MSAPFAHPKLIVHCPEHLQAVTDFADRTGQRAALDEKLKDLAQYLPDGYYCHLYTDFAPMSFFWQELKTADAENNHAPRGMIGGLIYHGKLEDGSRPETFSVSLTPQNAWSIHT